MMGLFTDDAETISEGATFLLVIAPAWAVFGGTMVIQGAFRGAGQTKVALGLSFLARWVFRIPLALALAFAASVTLPGVGTLDLGLGVGVVGVWISFSVGALLTFLVAVFWFRLGRWTEGVVEDTEGPGGPGPDGMDAVEETTEEGVDDEAVGIEAEAEAE
jgi:Na+-driven multidrug efflux pump